MSQTGRIPIRGAAGLVSPCEQPTQRGMFTLYLACMPHAQREGTGYSSDFIRRSTEAYDGIEH